MSEALTVGDIGELALIERLKPFCQLGAVGDDAALMTLRPGFQLVVTTDVLVDGVHFSDRTTPPYSVGWRSAAANLSDLAAMGADALGITVGLGLPKQTPWPWVEALYQGMSDCLSTYGGQAIHGGDLCRSNQRTVSITALGEVEPQWVICRNAATADMTVVVTGAHGGSRAGLAVLLGEIREDFPDAAAWVKAHQRPVPRFDAIAQLKAAVKTTVKTTAKTTVKNTVEASAIPKIAGMDSSDGLANALLQLSHSSGVGIDICQSSVPLPPGLEDAVGFETALNWALYGGEDFELVLCLPNDVADAWLQMDGAAIAIGRTTANSDNKVRLFETTEGFTTQFSAYQQIEPRGFQHF
ncbi:MAG: thiamine-phosphate kinase [Cyanobacteria bacterium P01_D01_bin.105]